MRLCPSAVTALLRLPPLLAVYLDHPVPLQHSDYVLRFQLLLRVHIVPTIEAALHVLLAVDLLRVQGQQAVLHPLLHFLLHHPRR